MNSVAMTIINLGKEIDQAWHPTSNPALKSCMLPTVLCGLEAGIYIAGLIPRHSRAKCKLSESKDLKVLNSRLVEEYGLFTKRQNFKPVQIESICRQQFKCE